MANEDVRERFNPFSRAEWESILQYTSLYMANNLTVQKAVANIYVSDRIRFLGAAKRLSLYDVPRFMSYPPEKVTMAQKMLSVLLCAEDDENLQKELLGIFKRYDGKLFTMIRKVNNQNINAIKALILRTLNVSEIPLVMGMIPYLMATLSTTATGDMSRHQECIDSIAWRLKLAFEDREIELLECADASTAIKFVESIFILGTNKHIIEEFLRLLFSTDSADDVFSWCSFAVSHDTPVFSVDEKTNKLRLYHSEQAAQFFLNEENKKWFMENVGAEWIFALVDACDMAGLSADVLLYNSKSKDFLITAIGMSYKLYKKQKGEKIKIDFRTIMWLYIILLLTDLQMKTKKTCVEYAESEIMTVSLDDQKEIKKYRDSIAKVKDENEALKRENEMLKEQIARASNAERRDVYRAEKPLRDEIEALKKENESLRGSQKELMRLRELVLQQAEEQKQDMPEDVDAKVSLNTVAEQMEGKRIIVLGGHPVLHKRLRESFPDLTLMDGTIKNQSFEGLKTADLVVLVTRHMCHPAYFKAMAAIEKNNVPFMLTSANSVVNIADVISDGLQSA